MDYRPWLNRFKLKVELTVYVNWDSGFGKDPKNDLIWSSLFYRCRSWVTELFTNLPKAILFSYEKNYETPALMTSIEFTSLFYCTACILSLKLSWRYAVSQDTEEKKGTYIYIVFIKLKVLYLSQVFFSFIKLWSLEIK